METIEYGHFYSIDNFFPSNVKAGFTTTDLNGIDVDADMSTILSTLGSSLHLAYMKQLHSDQVQCIEKEGIYEGDGLFTTKYSIVLVVKSADCLPLFLYDNNTGNIGLIHLGWKSARESILERIPFRCEAAMVLAGVGLRRCCYEVGDFLKYTRLALFIERKDKSLYFDPIAFSKTELMKKGLKETNFTDVDICSLSDPRDFFSYRRNNTEKRTLSFIVKV